MFKLECVGTYEIKFKSNKVIKICVQLADNRKFNLTAFDPALINEIAKNYKSKGHFCCNDGYLNIYKDKNGVWINDTNCIISSVSYE